MSRSPRSAHLLPLVLVALLAAPARAAPEPMERPLLYVAVSAETTWILLGTLHVPDTRVTAVAPLVERAVGRADALYTEVDFSRNVHAQLMPFIRLPRNRNLRQILGPALEKRVEALLAQRGQSLTRWERIEPWVLDTHVGELFAPEATRDTTTLDQVVFGLAREKGKTVGGLERVYEQARVFDVLSYRDQVALLEDTVARVEKDRREGTNSVEDMIQAYLSGDLQKLLDEVHTYYDFDLERDRRLYRRMHAERNERMLERLAEKTAEAPTQTHMLVTGAAHLGGPQGMLAQLREKGFVVWRVEADADLPADRRGALRHAIERARRSKRVGVLPALERARAALAETPSSPAR